jgi:hypothetical protein
MRFSGVFVVPQKNVCRLREFLKFYYCIRDYSSAGSERILQETTRYLSAKK